MPNEPTVHHRRSIRLKGYDYSQAGCYFVTICVQMRECLFGEIGTGGLHLHDAGLMLEDWWSRLPNKYAGVETDAFIVMPNHIHGILVFNPPEGSLVRECAADLGNVVSWFKTMTTNAYIRGVKEFDWPRFQGTLWQRNYYEHIIRTEDELDSIREYIGNNPAQWASDHENPDCVP